MNARQSAVALMVVTLGACAQLNDGLTPSVRVTKDSFDGATVIRQPSVAAGYGLTEGWNTLGFDWNSKWPDSIFVTAGTHGITRVLAAAFNADGKIIELTKFASDATDFEAGWSRRRFEMTWIDFQTVAAATEVKFRVSKPNEYTVSTFGQGHQLAIVSPKIGPFVSQVREARKALGRLD